MGEGKKRTYHLYALVAFALFMAHSSLSGQDYSAAPYQKIDPDLFFDNHKYSYYKEDLRMEFLLRKRTDVHSFSGVFFTARSNRSTTLSFMADWDENNEDLSLFILSKTHSSKHQLGVASAFFGPAPVKVSLHIDFHRDLTTIRIDTARLVLRELGFNTNDGYKLYAFPVLSESDGSNTEPILKIEDQTIETRKTPQNSMVWVWLILIIVADLAVFIGVQVSRARRKKRNKEETSPVIPARDSFSIPELPRQSAIHLFGEFRVYDREGNDITKKFSPLMKELLALILISSAGQGISSDKLKELLWYDKSAMSARNNRAVYIGKIRALLDTLGEYELNNNNGHWLFSSEEIFVDYLEYAGITWENNDRRSDIERLIYLTHRGNLLSEADYRWLDAYKSEVSDTVIEKLWTFGYAHISDSMQDFIVALADTIFRFEHINEQALYLKCKSYSLSGRHSPAKNTFDLFCEEYKNVYGEAFPFSFTELLEKTDWS